ncbi:hypothetical protein [Providencia alcalifaciens]|uniref:Competence protein n=1 Tax=Providencia alcalifaciens TaxID=126385 RepID=A0AAW9V9W6_9GAMM|nr:hypothetical protein [Providencia alcalifaciens]EKT65839.1 hypothetical protein OO9_08266 [Providencia alcalifaciens Dmel2]MTC34408.1 hypothetical protein [Providencia alcalifaciens]
MAFFALDPNTLNLKHIDWFQEHRIEQGLCAVCGTKMEIRAAHTPNTATHFWHGRNINCLTITKNRVRYEQLASSEYDDEQALILRAQVRHNLYEVYLTFHALSDVGKWQEFKDALYLADQMNIWRYKGLTQAFVPYILVTFVDLFLQKNNPHFRKTDFFFILSPLIRTLDQLWNNTTQAKRSIIKMSSDFNVIDIINIPDDIMPLRRPSWFDNSMKNLLV